MFHSKTATLQNSVSVMVYSLSGLDQLTEENVAAAMAVVEESSLSRVLVTNSMGRILYDTARRILEDPDRRKRMSSAMSSLGTIDASEKIYAAVMDLRSRGRK